MNKLDNWEIEKIINDRGFTLLSTYSENGIRRLVIEDEHGYRCDALYQNIRRGQGIDYVAKSNSYSLYNIENFLKINEEEFELCSDNVFIDAKKHLKFYCHVCYEFFYASWDNISHGDGCSVCAGKQVGEKHSLEYLRPDIAKEWSAENVLRPSEVSVGSNKKVWWICSECDHRWPAEIVSRTITGRGCPVCAGKVVSDRNRLSILYPEIAAEWHPTKNGSLTPDDVSYASNKNIWWKCIICEHEWEAKPATRTNGCGCAVCAGDIPTENNNLVIRFPESVYVWDYDNNEKRPEECLPFSSKKVYWLCENEIHESYLRPISKAVRFEFRCPECMRERDESFLQEKVRNYLHSFRNVTINHERNCSIVPVNPETGKKLPFDNEAEELRLIIEVNGMQHFEITGFHRLHATRNGTTPQEEFEYQQWKDQYKKEYALSQGYYYLEIPYWMDDEQESWKQAIDEMIEYILQEGDQN